MVNSRQKDTIITTNVITAAGKRWNAAELRMMPPDQRAALFEAPIGEVDAQFPTDYPFTSSRVFADLPMLADALAEADCTSAELLAHCRHSGPHVRGCWAVDLILGKP